MADNVDSENPVTREQFFTVSRFFGETNNIIMDLQYKLYLAIFLEDEKEIEKAQNDYFFNYKKYTSGGFN